MRPTLTEELCNSVGSGVVNIRFQSQEGAVSFARHGRMPEPKSVVVLKNVARSEK